ncbi:MAG: tRNA (cytidine(34)-2'-O)-methyltransferase [Bifidobacteriaceae bacterium]|jgi:tRNA (cytidine/uridine-2'-O-)-methyltransferase|nr:tRNA (cytidine(34)-2'-O)-methyltransferase [Bifidobacteriaceae bacterium]
MFHVVFFAPCIPQNTGNAIRLAAVTGVTLHLVEPLGFELTDTKLRRSGLDYHDLAELQVHPDLAAALSAVGPQARVFAFTTHAGGLRHTDVDYQAGDVLLFGPEPDGLPEWVKVHPRVTAQVRIPMLPARRSLNLANSAAIAVYEAWRQHDFGGHR